MDSPGLWYLNLSFSLSNGDVIIFKRENETKLIGNNEWTIYRNNEEIGTVSTDFSFKNKRKLRESLYLHYEGNTYHFKSSSIKSKTEISIDNLRIATGQRLSGPVYELMISNSDEKEAELLFMVYILFNYQFGQ